MATDLPRAGQNSSPDHAKPPGTAAAGSDRAPGDAAPATSAEEETEPDARFTYANERTFLAWHRTALALVVAGLAIVQLLPPFPGIPFGRHILALPLIALGGALSIASYREWIRHQRALRRGEPMGASHLPRVLAIAITVVAVAAAVLSLLAPTTGS